MMKFYDVKYFHCVEGKNISISSSVFPGALSIDYDTPDTPPEIHIDSIHDENGLNVTEEYEEYVLDNLHEELVDKAIDMEIDEYYSNIEEGD